MEKITFVVHCNTKDYYFIGLFGEQVWDYEIAKELNLKVEDYKKTLVNRFNGFADLNYDGDIFFKTNSEAEKALEWVNSIYMSIILAESEIAK